MQPDEVDKVVQSCLFSDKFEGSIFNILLSRLHNAESEIERLRHELQVVNEEKESYKELADRYLHEIKENNRINEKCDSIYTLLVQMQDKTATDTKEEQEQVMEQKIECLTQSLDQMREKHSDSDTLLSLAVSAIKDGRKEIKETSDSTLQAISKLEEQIKSIDLNSKIQRIDEVLFPTPMHHDKTNKRFDEINQNFIDQLLALPCAHTCTYFITGSNFCMQEIWDCETCKLTGGQGICKWCALHCHKGHKLKYTGVRPGFYCDCSTDGKCCLRH